MTGGCCGIVVLCLCMIMAVCPMRWLGYHPSSFCFEDCGWWLMLYFFCVCVAVSFVYSMWVLSFVGFEGDFSMVTLGRLVEISGEALGVVHLDGWYIVVILVGLEFNNVFVCIKDEVAAIVSKDLDSAFLPRDSL